VELRSWIEQAYGERRPMLLRDVEWTPPNSADGEQFFDVHVSPLLDQGSIMGIKVTFLNVTRSKKLADELHQSKHELETAYEELQTTNEELQSTVEEMETTNEELQSTNEEMETMNEELQSTNEELQTINAELSDRSSELNQTNAFLESILGSLKSGVAVLDQDLKVSSWNNRAEDLWGLRPDEVVGKHFLNLDIGLPLEPLKACIRGTMSGEETTQRITLQATNRRGKTIQCKVTCTPLKAGDGSVRGAILLMDE
jgi:two-component system CheB/CheR fusion protein